MEKAKENGIFPASDSDSPERSRAKSSAKDLTFWKFKTKKIPPLWVIWALEIWDDKCKRLLILSTLHPCFLFGGCYLAWKNDSPGFKFDTLASSQQLRADTIHFSSKGCACCNQNMAHLVNSSGPSSFGFGQKPVHGRKSQLRTTSRSLSASNGFCPRIPAKGVQDHATEDTQAPAAGFDFLKTLKADWNEKSCQNPGDIPLYWVKKNFHLKGLLLNHVESGKLASFWCLLIKAVAVLEK